MWRVSQISRKRLAVQFPPIKSPLYLIETHQVVNCLLCFGTALSTFYLIFIFIFMYFKNLNKWEQRIVLASSDMWPESSLFVPTPSPMLSQTASSVWLTRDIESPSEQPRNSMSFCKETLTFMNHRIMKISQTQVHWPPRA